LRVLRAEPARVEKLAQNSRLFLRLATDIGLDTGTSRDTPVVPVIVGDSQLAIGLSNALFGRGINVQPVVYPAVEENLARLRFFLSSLHSEEQIRSTVEATGEELDRLTGKASMKQPASLGV
jgi:7-keto-8-aminopelargonate synthetase-like enzyme